MFENIVIGAAAAIAASILTLLVLRGWWPAWILVGIAVALVGYTFLDPMWPLPLHRRRRNRRNRKGTT